MPNNAAVASLQAAKILTDAYIAITKAPEIWHRDITQSLRYVMRSCANAIGVGRVGIWQLNELQTELTCLALYREDTNGFEQGMVLSSYDYPAYFKKIVSERLILVTEAKNNPDIHAFSELYLKPFNIYSMLSSSLRSGGKTTGVMWVENIGRQRIWDEEEQTFITSISDLISQILLIHTLRDRDRRFRVLFEEAIDAVLLIRSGRVCECNPAALRMFHCEQVHIIDSSISQLSPLNQLNGQNSAELINQHIKRAIGGGHEFFEWRLMCFDGSDFDSEINLNRIDIDGMQCLVATVRDISSRKITEDALLESQKQLEFRATHDVLTGLPNRDSLHQRAAHAVMSASQNHSKIAFLLLDLNRFKDVNDTLGHRIGDVVLTKVSERLVKLTQKYNAQLYRLGGDEFAILQFGVHGFDEVAEMASKINGCLAEPFEVEGMALAIDASIGLSVYPDHGKNSHALLRCADVAMYQAKTRGHPHIFYDLDSDSHSTRRLMMLADLGVAIRENQLQLHFQPRMNLLTDSCNGCEALLRWNHPEHGMVPPGDFIPVAEATDIIQPLSMWVVRDALKHIRKWLDMGLEVAVAINLSARNLIDNRCPDKIDAMLHEFNIPSRLLEIEITESALITDPHRAMQVVEQFNHLGIHLAIDDFGTGYSSLSYLKRLPIDTLKIDRSFVKDMLSDEADAVIVRSTIGLAHSFGLTVVAEGVEDGETLSALRTLNCDQAQGFYISRPIPTQDFEKWMITHNQKSDSIS